MTRRVGLAAIVAAALALPAAASDPPDDTGWFRRQAETASQWLRQAGITYDLDVAVIYQAASDVTSGPSGVVSIPYQLYADWALTSSETLGIGHLGVTAFGTFGLNYDPQTDPLSTNAGVISVLNDTIYPDPFVLDELYWKQVWSTDALVIQAGVVDLANWFDTNAVANDAFGAFLASSLTNNLSIPFPLYGGFGGLVRWRAGDDLTVMAGVADGRSNDVNEPWKTVRGSDLYELVEVAWSPVIVPLGRGNYRLMPWHAELDGQSGFGLALSLDQQLGCEDLVGFLRLGIGDQAVTRVGTFVSAGVGVHRPFGRHGDMAAIGFSWSDPAPGAGQRAETLIEAFYRIELVPGISLSPDVQVVLDPALNLTTDTLWAGAVRVTVEF